MGPGKGDCKSMRVLNRLVHWTDNGIEYEVDQRHVEIAIQELSFRTERKKSQHIRGAEQEKG